MPEKKKILVVDDNPRVIGLITSILEDEYDIIIANEGQKAISLAKHQQPDLILMDMMMPGMDGYEATRQLKNNPSTRGIPIIAVTARVMEGDREKSIAAGCDNYLSKPIDMYELIEVVEKHIEFKEQE